MFLLTYLCVLRLKKNPNSFNAWSLINWLSDATNLNTHRTPCFTSNAGIIDAGCSDISDIRV